MAAKVTKPGYWLITGNSNGQGVAGVVKYTKAGSLPNATGAAFVGGPNVKSLNVNILNKAIQKLKATFLYEVPATGNHNNVQSIAARAIGQGKALYTTSQAGAQPVAVLDPTNPITDIIALGAGAVVGAAGGAAEAGAGTAGAETAATGGVAGGVAGKVASGITSGVTSSLGKDVALAAFLSLFTSLQFWIRVGETIIGAALLLLGLRAMTTGNTSIPVPG